MHLFKEQAVRDLQTAARAIPVIDYGPYFAGEPGALDRVAKKVAHACENIGFFYALNHGVSGDLVKRAFAASRRFFALPPEQKRALRLNDNNIGYLPVNASTQGASTVHKATKPNLNESFFVSHDRGPGHPDVIAHSPLRGQNQWPAADMPGLRADMMTYFAALHAMCQRMLPPFAVALGMPADFFAPYFAGEAHATLRFLHYPPQRDVEDNVFGQGPHTDNAFMTALARTEVPGLAVRLPSGEWFPPPIIPGTFLINLGNIMRRWSNDRFLSTPHGVLNDSGADRYSIAYFHSPNRTGSSNACRPAPAQTTRRAIRPLSTAIWCSTSTVRTIFTRRAIIPKRRHSRQGKIIGYRRTLMFDLDRFITDCRGAVAADPTHRTAREVVARAVADPDGVLAGLGVPKRAGVTPLHRSPDLTILNVVWGPRMTILPHNHLMWAVIGVYTGREDNIFWRRLPQDATGRIEAAGAKSLGPGDAEPRPRHRPLGHQPCRSPNRRDPCLWRRFLRGRAQRMGPRDAFGAALRP